MSGEFAVIDFETTGLSAETCRVIEVAAVIVRNGAVAESFVQLMHPGHRLPFFITGLTGITDEMLEGKPSPETVMPDLMRFLGDRPCVAHNASFDSRFYHAEMKRSGTLHERKFFCTMMLSRRLIPDLPSYKLGSLTYHLNLAVPAEGNCHRALYDVLLTVELWKRIGSIISERIGGKTPGHEIYHKIMKKSKATVNEYLDKLAE
jgi:DNA polymerase-3 subunit epsilon